jgi:hypothetical protein
MSKNTLQSLTAAAKAATDVSRAEVHERIAALPPSAFLPSSQDTAHGEARSAAARRQAVSGPTRSRLNLYLTTRDDDLIKVLRKVVVNATGESASDNALVLTALRTIDLSMTEALVRSYKTVLADDLRRKPDSPSPVV